MMYKIEPHLHTKHVSKCGWLYAEELAKGYHEAGYAAIAVTDHYNVNTWEYLGIDPTLVRLGWVMFCALGGSGFLAYIIAAIIIPRRPDVYRTEEQYL